LLQKFFQGSLFVLELGVVYGVTAAASAYIVQSYQEEVVTAPPVVRREVRIVVVPSGYTEKPAAAIEEVEIATVEEVTPVEEVVQSVQVAATIEDIELLAHAVMESRTVSENPFDVPFYSQFTDISSPTWQKVGCGIASLAMLIDFYSTEAVSVDRLLDRGIKAGAYLENAGWTHAGLIGLSQIYDLTGESVSLSDLSMKEAFSELTAVVEEGPVMVSVHYTFEPTNPIPHLVVIRGVQDGKVFYNDPAEVSGGGSLPIEKFQRAWKKRYISIRPA